MANPLVTIERSAEAIEEVLNECDGPKNESGGEYAQGVADALGWVLGYYEKPEVKR